MKETCWKNQGFTGTFQNNIKVRFALILKIKINAYSVSCCDVRKCTVLKYIFLPARASYMRYKGYRGKEGCKANEREIDLRSFKEM